MSTTGPIRVLLVDDHAMFVASLARVLRDEDGIDVVGTAGSCTSGVALAEQLQPAVAVVDYHLPDGNGVAATASIHAVSPRTRVLVLTGSSDHRVVSAAIEAGCAGFLTKDKAVHELVAAVRVVDAGDAYLSPEVLAGLFPRLGRGDRGLGSDLTAREREVLELVAVGLANKDIATRLCLSLHTVRNHVQNILVKLGAHSKLEAVSVAAREGVLEPRR